MDVADHLAQVVKGVREHGWVVQGIHPCAGQDGKVYAHTVGLTDAGLPELLVAGLDSAAMAEILNRGARFTLSSELSDGDVVTEFCSVPLQVKQINNEPAVVARKLYPDKVVELLQLVWPDSGGAYPGDSAWLHGDIQEIATA